MVFQFKLMDIDGVRSGNWEPKAYTLPQLKTIMESWQTGLDEIGWNSLFWEIMIIQEQFQDLEMIHQNIGNKAVKCLRLSYMV